MSSQFESLEARQLLSGTPTAKFGATAFYFNDVQTSASGGAGASPSQGLKISNTGTAALTIPSGGITLGGGNASEFTSSSTGAITINAGSFKTINLAFNAKALGVRTATLTIKTNDAAHKSTTINLRGLGTAGTGGNLEPSLQRILDLFQIPDKVGEPHPEQTAFPIPPSTPNDEVQMQTLAKAGSGNVTVQLLAVFDNFKTPATAFGTYTPGNASSAHQLFTVPNSNDAQSVHPTTSGSTSFDPGSNSFGIYTLFPAFSNRMAFSEDALNTWETVSSHMKKVRFYPLKNADGSKVANAFVFATEAYNKAFDSNDVVGIIRNVKAGTGSTTGGGTSDGTGTGVSSITPGGSAIGSSGGNGSIGNIPGLSESNLDHAPSNDRLVANRIENPDPIRPNVVHDHSELRLTNTGGSSMTVTVTLDNPAWKFKAGGGTFTISPGAVHEVDLSFVGTASGSTILKVFNGNMKITANGKTDIVKLNGLWQANSEKLPSGKYDEPNLATLINSIFGYKTVILNPGQTTSHKGQPGAVGDEVASAYWKAADSSKVVDVRMIAATHRQNDFDPVTHAPLPANSEISWYVKGNPSGKKFLFKHNIDEGQSLLQHIAGSTTAVAEKTFSPGSNTFGFEVDKHFSDRTLNALDFDPKTGQTFPGSGYSWRFFPLKDENGKLVPNTYIAAMDYTANQFANWDYNDNVYLITNIKPASTTTTMSTSISVAQATPAKNLFASGSSDATDSTDIIR